MKAPDKKEPTLGDYLLGFAVVGTAILGVAFAMMTAFIVLLKFGVWLYSVL